MTTDNKTLADVKPGGRVRLGDAPWPEIDAILADAYSAGATGLPFEGIARRAAVCKEVAALSAQPSPGGQEDDFSKERVRWFKRAGEYLARAQAAEAELANFDRFRATSRRQSAVEFLLNSGFKWDGVRWNAARQPVEVSEGGFRAATSRQTASAESNATAEALIAAARQLNKQPDSVALGEATEFCIEKGDRKPVGYFDPDVLAHLTEGLIDPVGVLRRKPNGKSNVPVWLGPPAQAVDLADFKALYRAYVRLLESGRDRIRDLGGTCDPVDVMEANDVDLQAARRVLDSQAVGNG